MRSERRGGQSRGGLAWWALAAGLSLVVGRVVAAEPGAAESWSRLGLLAERKAVFSEVLLVTNPPVSVTNPAKLGALVEPRLVTNVAPPAGAASSQPVRASTPAPVPQGRSMESLDSKQKLGVGDRLTFRVIEDQEEPKSLTITDAGELDVPELGLVTAVGQTCKALAYEIKGKLEQATYYRATVILGIELLNKTPSGRRIYVSGYVQRPGQQEIPGGETWTVAKAIMRAGGFTIYADKKHVQLVRAGQKGTPGATYIVNVTEVLEKGRTDKDLAVEAEDFIIVPPRGVVF